MLKTFEKIIEKRAWVYVIGIIAFAIAHLHSLYASDKISSSDPSNDFSWIQFWGPDIVPHPHIPDPNAPPPGPRIVDFYRYKAECAIAKEWKEFLDRYPEQERYEMLQEIIKYIVGDE